MTAADRETLIYYITFAFFLFTGEENILNVTHKQTNNRDLIRKIMEYIFSINGRGSAFFFLMLD